MTGVLVVVVDGPGIGTDIWLFIGYDARFPQQNQYVLFPTARMDHRWFDAMTNRDANVRALRTKHCWQNYVDYYKCAEAKGEEFRPCTQVLRLSPQSYRLPMSRV